MDLTYLVTVLLKLIPFALITIQVVAWSFGLGCLFGGILAFAKLKGPKFIQKIAYGYTTVIRCTPFIIMLFLVFYGLPYLFEPIGIDANVLDKKVYTIITMTMYSASNLSDIFRSAYTSLGKGQSEAAACIGMSGMQSLFRIMLPQVVFICLPMVSNVLVSELQDVSLAFTIGLVDIIGQAKVIDSLGFNIHTLEVYIAAGIIFWVLALVFENVLKQIHNYLGDKKKLRTS